VVSLLIAAAELHVRADLRVVDAAEQSLDAEPGTGKRQSALTGRSEARRNEAGPGETATESAIG
jgi:hypothetical protein